MSFILSYGSYILTPVHVIVCLILIAVVLLQTGKASDFAGVFGGQGTQAAFGPRGMENTLSRLTKIAAVVFMVTSFSLALIQSKARGRLEQLDLPSTEDVQAQSPAAAITPAADSEMPEATVIPEVESMLPAEAQAAPGDPSPAAVSEQGSSPGGGNAGEPAASPTP